MMIDPRSHLRLLRQEQDERDRHLGHRAAMRAAQDTADVGASTSLPLPPWQLLRTGRRPARGSPTG
ncbi:hypothetical protein [Nitriliruptor alkaliphilus]|uniref:hypothetical protein n=1 Tax=Nitriliruptor alkaliphilus TaxID=427918 RepID=UPI000696EED9|nr:hypothetical protein [Nitriliruptor alkaliphilus]